jgi:hypothetical protein
MEPVIHPYQIGNNYLVKTVTNYFIGELSAVYEQELVLEKASWVADMGQYSKCLSAGVLDEVEYFGYPIIVGRGAIVDVVQWWHALPAETK